MHPDDLASATLSEMSEMIVESILDNNDSLFASYIKNILNIRTELLNKEDVKSLKNHFVLGYYIMNIAFFESSDQTVKDQQLADLERSGYKVLLSYKNDNGAAKGTNINYVLAKPPL